MITPRSFKPHQIFVIEGYFVSSSNIYKDFSFKRGGKLINFLVQQPSHHYLLWGIMSCIIYNISGKAFILTEAETEKIGKPLSASGLGANTSHIVSSV
jgi:hypothetical protein